MKKFAYATLTVVFFTATVMVVIDMAPIAAFAGLVLTILSINQFYDR